MIRRIESDVTASCEWARMLLDSLDSGAPVTASAIESLPAFASALRALNDRVADDLASRLESYAETLKP